MLFFLNLLLIKKILNKVTQIAKKILSSTTVSNIDNNHIRMISKGSCDTEDWSNNAENSVLIIFNNNKNVSK